MREHPFEALPDTVEVGGRRVQVETDFRFGVALETELFCDAPDVEGLLRRFYLQGIPSPVEEAVRRMIEFYAHGDRPQGEGQGGDVKRCYDFAQDADALLASFLGAYDIDLSTAKLHWWTFRRLMLNLPADSPFMARIRYRTADLKKLGQEERKHYKKMRALYAIRTAGERPPQTVAQREEALRELVRRRFEEARERTDAGGTE